MRALILMMFLAGCVVDNPHGAIPADGVLTVVAGGDSNTEFGCDNGSLTWPHCTETALSWLDYLRTLDAASPLTTAPVVSAHAFVNEGLVASSACSRNLPPPSADLDGAAQMPHILSHSPDVVILAYGTNDLFYGFTPAQTVACYQALYVTASEAGAVVFVALTPPQPGRAPGVTEAMVEDLNARLLVAFGTRQTIDFFTGVTAASLQADGLHVTDAEQQRRAGLVYAALQAWPYR